MEIPQEIDEYLRESMNYSLDLPVSTRTLELKLRSCEEAQRHFRDQCCYLKLKLIDKDKIIVRTRAESSMNAQAVKKFVHENQKLATECANLSSQCAKWEMEREILMELGYQEDDRAKEAELRVHCLEDELRKLSEELHYLKQQQSDM